MRWSVWTDDSCTLRSTWRVRNVKCSKNTIKWQSSIILYLKFLVHALRRSTPQFRSLHLVQFFGRQRLIRNTWPSSPWDFLLSSTSIISIFLSSPPPPNPKPLHKNSSSFFCVTFVLTLHRFFNCATTSEICWYKISALLKRNRNV